MNDIKLRIFQTGHNNKSLMKRTNTSLSTRMVCMFKYECMKNPAVTKDTYWEFKNNKIIWLVDFNKWKSKIRYKQQIRGKLDIDDMSLMKERIRECKNPNELYDKFYKAYTRESFVEILKLTLKEEK